MRFDNPIKDHGFVFPDIAKFPDVINEPRYEDKETDEEYLQILRNSLKSGDLENFLNILHKFTIPNDNFTRRLKMMFNFYSMFYHTRRKSNLPSNKIYEDLFENGVSVTSIETKELYNLALPKIDKLLSVKDWAPPPGTFDRAEQLGQNFKDMVQTIFEQNGVITAASKYNQGSRKLKVSNVVLHIATPTDQNWKQFLYDCKTVTKTTNLHIDPKEDVIKAMIYLNDISLESGPFSYIEKTNRWIYDDLQNLFGRAISTGSYCDTKESRADVFKLPSFLRVSHNFGRLLLDDDPMQKQLLDKENYITSDKGNCVVFDPAGMHRGGICKSKTRIALQILMK